MFWWSQSFFNGHWLSLHSILRSNLVFSVSIVASSSSSQDYHPSVNIKVLRSPIKYRNSYNDLNALDKRVVSGTGTMAIGCWISLALLLCYITFSFCYLTSKSPSPWNLTLLFCCLLTRYTKILHLKSACPCLPCFAGCPHPIQVKDQRPSYTLYLHIKKISPLMHILILPFFAPLPLLGKKETNDRNKRKKTKDRNTAKTKETKKQRNETERNETKQEKRKKETKKQRKKGRIKARKK